jgi:hypothetical protein
MCGIASGISEGKKIDVNEVDIFSLSIILQNTEDLRHAKHQRIDRKGRVLL